MAQKQTLGTLIVELLFKDKEYASGLKSAEVSTDKFAARASGTMQKFQNVTVTALKAVTASVAAFGAASVAVGTAFEQQMAMAGALRGLTQADDAFQQLTDQARLLGSTTEFTATQAGAALENLMRAGQSTADAIATSNSALVLAGTSAASLEGSTQMLVSVQRQFSLGAADSTRITNVLSSAMRNSMLDFVSLREAMKFGGVAGAAFGMELEEVAAAIAKFRDLGLEGSMAGTQFRSAMAFAGKQTKKQAELLAKYNLTLEDINPETKKFEEILLTVGRAGMTATDSMKVFGKIAGGSIGLMAAQAAAGTLELGKLEQTLIDSSKEGNTASEMYKAIGNTVAYQAKIAYSALQELFITVFDLFKGPLKEMITSIGGKDGLLNTISRAVRQNADVIASDFADVFNRITNWINDNKDDLADTFVNGLKHVVEFGKGLASIITFLGQVAKWGDHLVVLLPTVFAVGYIIKAVFAIKAFAAALGIANGAALTLAGTVTVTTGGLYAIVAAAGAVVAGLVYYISSVTGAANETERMERATKDLEKAELELLRTQQESNESMLAAEKMKARLALKAGDLTDAERARYKAILEMDAATVTADVNTGRLIKTQTGYFTVAQLFKELGPEVSAQLQDEADKRANAARRAGEHAANLETIHQNYLNMGRTGLALKELQNKADSFFKGQTVTAEQVAAKIEQLRREQRNEMRAHDRILSSIDDEREKRDSKAAARRRLNAQENINTGANEVDQLAQQRQQLRDQIGSLLDGLNADYDKSYMTEEELQSQSLEKQKGRALGHFVALANTYAKGTDEREQILREGGKAVSLIEKTQANKELKKAKDAERKKAQEKADIQKEAEEKLKDLRRDTMTNSQRLEREKADVLASIMLADYETRLAIAEQYEKLIAEAQGEEDAAGETDDDSGNKEKFLKKLMRVARVAASIVRRAAKAAMSVLGGFKLDPSSMVKDLIEAKKQAEEEGLAFDMAENAKKMVQESVDGALAFADTFVDMLPVILQQFAERAPELMQKLADALPVVIQTFADNIPTIINAFLSQLPTLVQSVVIALFNAIGTLLQALPQILTTFLQETLPTLIKTIVAYLPLLILEFVKAIPSIIDAVVMSIPAIVGAFVESLPILIRAVLASLPDIFGAIIAALPTLAEQLIEALVTKPLPALPKIALELGIGIVKAIFGFVEKIGQAIGDAFRSKKGKERAKNRREKRTQENQDKREQELMDELSAGSASAFSGMSYVPATMRMTVHKGEAVIPADRAASMRSGGPAVAGAGQQNNLSAGSEAPIEISVIAEGRLLDAVQIKAANRGHATGMQKAIRRASGAKIGFQRGKFSAYT